MKSTRRIHLERQRESATRARHFVRETLMDWGYEAFEADVSLAVTELVTNAVVHAASDVLVTLVDRDGAVQVRVGDRGPAPPRLIHPNSTSTGGRGVMLVDAVADHWGIEPDPPGKTVWLDISGRCCQR